MNVIKENLQFISMWLSSPSLTGWVRTFLSLSLITAFAMFAGVLPALLPWPIVVGLCVGAVYLLVLIRWPTIGIAGYLCIVLVSPDFKISDVVTILVLGALILRQLAAGLPLGLKGHPLYIPFLCFFLIGLLSLFLAITIFKNQIPLVYRDGRVFVYWLWLPLLIWMVQGEQITRANLQRLVLFFACFIAIVALLQGATGIQFVAVGRVADLDGSAVSSLGTTRVQLPGFVFVSFALVWLAGSLTVKVKLPLLNLLLVCVLAAAIYMNLGRALWAWTVFALLLTVFLLGYVRGLRLFALLVVGGVIGLSSIYVVKPVVLETMIDRVSSVQREGGNRTSYGWRKWENEDALNRIIRTPVVGVGIGGEYRTWIAELRVFEDHTRYVHNTFLFYALKLGVPGLVALLWTLGRIWWRALLLRKLEAKEAGNGFYTAAAAFFPAMIGLSFTQPDLAGAFGALFVSLVGAALLWDLEIKKSNLSRWGTKQ